MKPCKALTEAAITTCGAVTEALSERSEHTIACCSGQRGNSVQRSRFAILAMDKHLAPLAKH